MRAITGAAVALLLLAGCSGKGGSNTSAAAGEQQPQEPANLETDPYTQAVPLPAASPTPLSRPWKDRNLPPEHASKDATAPASHARR